jgi:hypothetical protein
MDSEPEAKLPRPAGLAEIVEQPGVPPRAKLHQWLRRYGLAECVGIAGALLGSFLVRHATHSVIAAAYGAAWGETIGYTAVIIIQAFLAESRAARSQRREVGLRGLRNMAAGLLAEFGPAGLLDTLLVRPITMGLGTRLLGPHIGVIAGKLTADVLFYVPVIYTYERRKHRRRYSL